MIFEKKKTSDFSENVSISYNFNYRVERLIKRWINEYSNNTIYAMHFVSNVKQGILTLQMILETTKNLFCLSTDHLSISRQSNN